MLSLAHIGRGAEDYHLKAVGHGATLYYSEKGEVAGAWIGKGATDLGLRGPVEDDPLLAVLAGYEPSAPRVATDGQEVWEAGRRLVRGPGNRDRLPGIDATFKAPKSVSLLWALGHDIEAGQGRGSVSDVVTRAHDEAVRAAFAVLEEQAAWGRRGHGGEEQVRTEGFVAASFRHRTSRAEDPHLHTHVLVANMAHKEDGSWGALDGRLLYAWAKTCGYLYESELRARLLSRAGRRVDARSQRDRRGRGRRAVGHRPVLQAAARVARRHPGGDRPHQPGAAEAWSPPHRVGQRAGSRHRLP